MSSQSSGRRRFNNMRQFSAEDEALDIISKEAEARLDAKRAARVEAREIRQKELEKHQNESEGKQDSENASNKVRQQVSGSRSGSRRGSTESDLELKDLDFKAELRELQEKYKAAMVTSAQLDNEKQSLVYQVDLLKDQLEEQSEGYTELQREYKEKCRVYDFQKRDLNNLEHELSVLKQHLEIKDRLIEESGFVIIANEKGEPVLQKSSQVISTNGPLPAGSLSVSAETQDLLKRMEGASLGTSVGRINTNKSRGSQQARHSVTSGSVDACDGSRSEHIQLSENCSGDRLIKFDENLLTFDSNIEKVVDVVLHDGDDVVASASVLREHDMSLENGNVDIMSKQNESRVSTDTGSYSGRDLTTQDNTHVIVQTADCTPQGTATESDKDSGDNETDDVDEFFDAISTPSPSSKIDTFTEQGVGGQQISTNDNEGTSVDPEPETEDNIIRLEASSSDFTDRDRESITLDNVTVTESSSDVVNENEETDNKESVPETENLIVVDHEENEQAEVKDETENHDQNVLEAPQNETINTEKLVEGLCSENFSNQEEILEVEVINNNSETVLCDLSNNTETIQHKQEEEERHLTDVKEIVEDKSESRTVAQTSQANEDNGEDTAKESEVLTENINTESFVCKTEVQISQTIQVNSEDTAKESEVIEVLTENINTESFTCPKEDKEKQAVVDETNLDHSNNRKSQVISTVNNPQNEELVLKDDSEQHDSEDEGDLEDTEISKEGESVVKSSQVISDEENEDEKNDDLPIENTSKIIERTVSVGGSEVSDGVGLDNYDLDDIDDILSTETPASAVCMELNTTSSSKAKTSVTAGSDDHVDNSQPISPSDKHVEGREATLIPDGKKSKGDKKKSSKKENKEKIDKIKSGEKESKNKAEKIKSSEKESKNKSEKRKSSEKEGNDKAEKVKSKEKESKEKPEKNKSSKRDSTLEKKAEKSKSKKEAGHESKVEAVGGEEDRHSTAESQGSQEPDDLEQALDKQMSESKRSKSDKKTPKKLSILRKVFK